MKRFALIACAALAFLANSSVVRADWGRWGYSGYQPWYNIFALGHRPKITPEEERLQRFWHDYYDAQGDYYRHLEHIDWVAYYKNHGYEINQGGGRGGPGGTFGGPFNSNSRTSMVPVVVVPGMQYAVPNSPLNGPPAPYGPGVAPQPYPQYGPGPAAPMGGGGYYPASFGSPYN